MKVDHVSIGNQSTNEPVSPRLNLNDVSSFPKLYQSNNAASVFAAAVGADAAAANAVPANQHQN